MSLLSLFMTSTGIFCFVPISQRLVESGIIPASDSWRLPSFLIPRLYGQKSDGFRYLLAADDIRNPWSETDECHRLQSHDPQTSLYLEEDTFVTDQPLEMKCLAEWNNGMVSPLQHSTAGSRPYSPPIGMFYEHDSASFLGDCDSTLCDSCNSLLQHKIPPDHIPSVIRALALFEARDQLFDVDFHEREIAALTNAFSMLRV